MNISVEELKKTMKMLSVSLVLDQVTKPNGVSRCSVLVLVMTRPLCGRTCNVRIAYKQLEWWIIVHHDRWWMAGEEKPARGLTETIVGNSRTW